MKSILPKAVCCLVLFLAFFPARAGRADIVIEALLGRMTLKEKIGQMTMLTIEAVSKGEIPFRTVEPHELDPGRLQRAVVDYHVGTLFNIAHHAFHKDYWRKIITVMQEVATTQTRLKIPLLYGIDALHGMNFSFGATLFPQQIGLAATWNPALIRQTARATAYEARATGISWVFSPTAEPGRNPVHSRFYESFGEDTHLAAAMTAAMVAGYHGENSNERVASTLKHFIGYSIPASGRDRAGANAAGHLLRENFLPPFAAGIKAGAETVLLNLSDVNGMPVHGDKALVQEMLKDELGFTGVVVSDWNAVDYLFSHHHVAASPREAVEKAINSGIDLVMVPFDLAFAEDVESLVKEGRVSLERIDDAVRRILTLKKELGLFDRPVIRDSRYPLYGSDTFREIARNAAAESLTLLKNSNRVLPLSKTSRILVTGFGADSMAALNGGWSYTWMGDETDSYNTDGVTIVEAIRAKVGADNVVFVKTLPDLNDNIEKAAEAAGLVDCIVLCLGETPYAEVFGNIEDLTLDRSQLELAERLSRSGKPVILILTEGRPRIISRIEKGMDSVMLAYLPGNEGGWAIAEALFGDVNPSGKLPFTYPAGPNALATYDHRHSEAYAFHPLYPFGWGLSYTRFAYENLKVEPGRLDPNGTLTVTVEVRNTGERPGREVVQLYTSDLYAGIAPPVKRLRGFDKISLEPGEKKTVTFTLSPRDLAFADRNNRWIAEAGEFTVTVGGLTRPFTLTGNRVFERRPAF